MKDKGIKQQVAAKAKKTKQKSRAGDDDIIDGTFTEADEKMTDAKSTATKASEDRASTKTQGRSSVALAALSCGVLALGIAGASLFEQQRATTAQQAQISILQDSLQEKLQDSVNDKIAPLQAEIAAANATIDKQEQQINKLAQMLELIANTPQADAKGAAGPSAEVMVALMMWRAVMAADGLGDLAPVIAALPHAESRLLLEEILQTYQAIEADRLLTDGQALLADRANLGGERGDAAQDSGFLADVAGWLSRAVKLQTVALEEAGAQADKTARADDDKDEGGEIALAAMTASQIYDATKKRQDSARADDAVAQWRARYESQQAIAVRLLAFVTSKLTEQKE